MNFIKSKQKKEHPKKFFGFTLAEVLITIVVLGVISAMTITVLIPNMQKQRLSTQLRSFHSRINQALRSSYVKNGEIAELPRSDYSYAQNVAWLETYITPFMRVDKIENCHDPNQYRRNAACVRLINGDLFEFVVDYNGADLFYFPLGKWESIENNKLASKRVFPFQFAKRAQANNDDVIKSNNYIEAYSYRWNGNKSDLYNNSTYGCKKGKKKFYCTKIIELNGWEIPKDYPF